MTPVYRIADRKDCRALSQYLAQNGQLLPMVELIKSAQAAARSLPARAFEAAYIESLEQLAADPSLVETYTMEGAAADRRDVARLEGRLQRLRSELSDVDERMRRLLGVFEESEVVPGG